LATSARLWRLAPGEPARVLAPLPYVRALERRADGAWVALTRGAEIHVWRAGRDSLVFRGASAGVSMVLREGVIWAQVDQYLRAFRPGEPPEVVAPGPSVPAARALLVDREGSLWIGGYRGLLQLPEPETVTWNDRDGLPMPPHARYVCRDRGGLWLSTWYGLSRLEPGSGAWRGRIVDADNRYRIVADGAGRLWTGGLRGFRERAGGRLVFHPVDMRPDSLMRISISAPRRDGTLWLGTSAGLFTTPRGAGAPALAPGAPPPGWGRSWRDVWVQDVLEDRSGTLWVSDGVQVAHAGADSVARGLPVAWGRDTLRDVQNVNQIVELPSGHLWLGTANGGMWRRRAGRWEEIPGARELRTRRIETLTRSREGGVWITGSGNLVRAVEDTASTAGWRIVERLSAWEGVPNPGGGEVLEEPDGGLWIASLAGLTHVPAMARHARREPPAVALVDLAVDGRPLPLDLPARLPYRRNRLELRFAALSFRDPGRIRCQIRLRAGAPWTESRDPDFRFVDLAPGRYHAEVRASLDGTRWSAQPVRVDFTVLRPWWLEGWAFALAALLVAALLYGAHRVRVGFLLRLERQRARIAMDLHDEMGSGLGGIGLLAGVAAGQEVDDAGRRRIAAEIADAAGDLGAALGDIVWSLRADAGTLESLALRVAERARRLFPDPAREGAGAAEVVTRFPAVWPALELPLELRRNLQLIAAEALHNAARHAGARRVEIGFDPEPGGRWRLWVRDDGAGLPPGLVDERGLPTGRAAGNGLRNLAARAAALGAGLCWRAAPGGGTVVEVSFDPRGPRSARMDMR
ncbi:MAG TPA: ATP-binding protein, partial [Candidatus Eisenbacteria bacterium]|nr:ATP-binding protein [Candidatus Eisenbacteria bacterium]